jgi:hypothetical protein
MRGIYSERNGEPNKERGIYVAVELEFWDFFSPFTSGAGIYYSSSCNLGGNGNVHLAQACVFFGTDLHNMSRNAWKSAGRTNLMVILH